MDEPNPHAPTPDAVPAAGGTPSSLAADGQMLRSDEKTMGMLCHLLALCGLVGVPFGSILGPLIMWLVKKDTSPYVDDQGRESLNFQITVILAIICCVPLILVFGLGILLMIVVAIGSVVLVIIASINAAGGTPYRYPMTIRFIK